jgi:ArsR family transcriptional regulator
MTAHKTCLLEHADASTPHAATAGLLDGRIAHQVAELFKAFSDPTRVRIINLLAEDEKCVGELSLSLGMSQPAISQQLRLLRTLRIVTVRREGKHSYYTLADEHVRNLFKQGLEHVQHE